MTETLFDISELVAPDYEPELTIQQRFWAKVQVNPMTDCWVWMAAKSDGYGRFAIRNGDVRTAHRLSYEWLIGPIAEGLHLDHLCRNRSCVNPDHLEPVTCRINVLRGVGPSAIHALKTHCPSGHEYTAANTYFYRGMRMCRQCRAEANARSKQSRAAKQLAANPADLRHGTLTGYSTYGCRCDRCKAANADYQREYRARRARASRAA